MPAAKKAETQSWAGLEITGYIISVTQTQHPGPIKENFRILIHSLILCVYVCVHAQ